jgi:hypothetical protein
MKQGHCLKWNDNDIINQFRVGNYDDADADVQQAWHQLLGDVLPSVSKVWAQKNTRMSRKMKEVINVATEAFVLWAIKNEYPEWTQALIDDNGRKKFKRIGKHRSTEFLQHYSVMYTAVATKREQEKSWDKAYRNTVRKQFKADNLLRTYDGCLDEAVIPSTLTKQHDTIDLPIGNYSSIEHVVMEAV